ncbi:sensor histidine kinase VxrA [Vibrio breoganii]|uniref:sensor histidine kinase VxrA n=1 Tax=Vibrio breoganii TaxID=553239 RepID=UPI000CB036B2|nr:histidine kinase [Vibrio breoganii]PML13462.1 histidine kinase [Vibrio breoganii]PMM47904.1 histidine kinase [Vibrio breoganii]PMP04287.1 histidine kinase [Vibrio breoganii]
MLYSLRTLLLFISLVTVSPMLAAKTLPQRLDTLVSLFVFEDAKDSYDMQVIQADFPTALINPNSMLPQTSKYPLKDIQLLYRLEQTCKGKLPLSPTVTEPLVFTRAMCRGTKLPLKWFARSNHIHPGGGTYAARYVKAHPDRFDELQQYMHINERQLADPDSLLGRLQLMHSDSISALLSGAPMMLQGNEFWLRKGDSYFVFDVETLEHNAKEAELSFNPVSQVNECFFERGNICWQQHDNSHLIKNLLYALVLLNLALIIGWSVYRWNSKREEMRSRMLILQILTHELRTPIASLSMTVEGFRREFEHLPETVYDEFRRLCEDSRRLRQLAEASKDYLQSDNRPLATEHLPSMQEWLDYKVENYSGDVSLNIEKDIEVRVNIYWLGTCIDNLVNNAIKYGVGKVELCVHRNDNTLIIEVQDEGNLSAKDWKQLRKPFVSEAGLGLGLTIVESMVGRMGGSMKLVGPPTKFVMEIPCGTDTTTR